MVADRFVLAREVRPPGEAAKLSFQKTESGRGAETRPDEMGTRAGGASGATGYRGSS